MNGATAVINSSLVRFVVRHRRLPDRGLLLTMTMMTIIIIKLMKMTTLLLTLPTRLRGVGKK